MEKIRRGKKGAPRKYDDAFKRKVVLEYHHSTDSMAAVSLKYGLGKHALPKWINWYEQDQQRLLTLGLMEAEANNAADAGTEETKPTSPEEFKQLQEELRQAKIKLACPETLIEITEKDLGIDIRKKAGTRSSEE